MSEKSTCIHFQKATHFAFLHNDRTKVPSYVISDDKNNEYNKSAEESFYYVKELYSEAVSNYQSRTKQKFQAKNYLVEAIVVIEDRHTLADIQEVANSVESRTGYRPVQISIHRDEGHIDKVTNEKIINTHAHIVFFTLDEQGKSLQRQMFNNKKVMKELQTDTANILNMRRGQSKELTNAEHLTHRQYKQSIKIAEQHKAQELQKWHNRLKEQFINILQSTSDAIRKFFMTEQINQMESENIQLKQQTADQQNQISRQFDKIKSITEEAEHYKSELIQERVKRISIPKEKEQLSQKPSVQQLHQQEPQEAKKSKSLSRSI